MQLTTPICTIHLVHWVKHPLSHKRSHCTLLGASLHTVTIACMHVLSDVQACYHTHTAKLNDDEVTSTRGCYRDQEYLGLIYEP